MAVAPVLPLPLAVRWCCCVMAAAVEEEEATMEMLRRFTSRWISIRAESSALLYLCNKCRVVLVCCVVGWRCEVTRG